jgi:hypothetical protein
MRRITLALAAGVLVWALQGPLAAGEAYESRFFQCLGQSTDEPGSGEFDPLEDPQGYVSTANVFVACGLQVAQEWAAGEFTDFDGPDAATASKTVKKLAALRRKLAGLDGKFGRERTKAARKAHIRAADPRLHAADGYAYRGIDNVLHAAMAEQLAALEVRIIELVEQYDALATDSETAGEKKALKFVVLAQLFVGRARTLLEEVRPKQSRIRKEIDEGAPASDYRDLAKSCRRQVAAAYDLFSAAPRSAEKAQKQFGKELDRQRKSLPCELTDPEVPFQGGGVVTLSVDGGPVQVLENGTAGVSIFRSDKKYVRVGTKTGQYPRISLFHEGKNFRGKGTYPVTRVPFEFSDPTPYKPTHAKGHYWSGTSFRDSDFYTTDSGTYTVTKFVLKKGKRRISGTYDVMMSTDDGKAVRLTGTFELCGFQIETREGID